MDIVGDSLTEPEWLEVQVPSAGDFRIWHLIFFGLSGVLSIGESWKLFFFFIGIYFTELIYFFFFQSS